MSANGRWDLIRSLKVKCKAKTGEVYGQLAEDLYINVSFVVKERV